MLKKFKFPIGNDTIIITQLPAAKARKVQDKLLSILGPSLSSALRPGGLESIELVWPGESSGLEWIRDIYVENAKLLRPNNQTGVEVEFPLSAFRADLFDGHPGLEFAFHAYCTRANFESFLADFRSVKMTLTEVE